MVYFGGQSFTWIPGVTLRLNDGGIPNHDYVVINDIGSTNATALICNTNHRPADGADSGGDWFGPNGMVVGGTTTDDNVPGFMSNRDARKVRLLRNTATDPLLEGIFRCEVLDATLAQQTLYVGLLLMNVGSNWASYQFLILQLNPQSALL